MHRLENVTFGKNGKEEYIYAHINII